MWSMMAKTVMRYKAAVLTISDRCSRGEREDRSGQVILDLLQGQVFEVVKYEIIPDEPEMIKERIVGEIRRIDFPKQQCKLPEVVPCSKGIPLSKRGDDTCQQAEKQHISARCPTVSGLDVKHPWYSSTASLFATSLRRLHDRSRSRWCKSVGRQSVVWPRGPPFWRTQLP